MVQQETIFGNLGRRQLRAVGGAGVLALLGIISLDSWRNGPDAGRMSSYGFSVHWMSHQTAGRTRRPAPPDADLLDFMAGEGFDMLRVPLSYWFWTRGANYRDIEAAAFAAVDGYLDACRRRGLQLCLSMRRAPGHCVWGQGREAHDLWRDDEAREGFAFHWRYLAERYRQVPGEELRFELLGDPPARPDQTPSYAELLRSTVGLVRSVSPQRPVMVVGVQDGAIPVHDLVDLDVQQCCLGHYPREISHRSRGTYAANPGLATLTYPCLDHERQWGLGTMIRHYDRWREWQALGHSVFVSEFGLADTMDPRSADAWHRDMLGLFRRWNWGFCFDCKGGRKSLGHELLVMLREARLTRVD